MKHLNHFYITFLFSIFILLFTSCESQNNKAEKLKENSQIYKGKIIKVSFTDKAGRVHEDIFDYFFKTKDGEYFIKISDGNVKRDEIAKYFKNKKTIKVRAKIILFGLWDTNDPNVQSRVGDYLIFEEIIE